MTATATLGSAACYSGHVKSSSWEGRHVPDAERFKRFVREVVCPRVSDVASTFESDLRVLATTEMATEFVEHLLKAVPEPESWEVGEALAECALQQDSGREVHWPWNTVRDRRTSRASLPGSDPGGVHHHLGLSERSGGRGAGARLPRHRTNAGPPARRSVDRALGRYLEFRERLGLKPGLVRV